MMHFLSMLLLHGAPETPVRATFGDGQVLMGEVHTKTLKLQSGSGLLEIPLEDVGEVVPAAVGGLGESEGRVDVWLRNGSELRGTWADPKLAMSILVGGDDVAIDLPMNDLSRFQLQGGAAWPTGPVYRMRTTSGDDFLVDPTKTELVVVNKFGTFAPKLSECVSVAPIGEAKGDWRIELQTGTVLIGHLQDNKVTVALPMGPDEISVNLDAFVSLRMESWGQPPPPAAAPVRREQSPPVLYEDHDWSPELPASEVPAPVPYSESYKPARARPSAPAWFDSAPMSATKDAIDE
jgi:hypothetical protein